MATEGETSGAGPDGAAAGSSGPYSCTDIGTPGPQDQEMADAGAAAAATAAGVEEPDFPNPEARLEYWLPRLMADGTLDKNVAFCILMCGGLVHKCTKLTADCQTWQHMHARDADTIKQQAQQIRDVDNARETALAQRDSLHQQLEEKTAELEKAQAELQAATVRDQEREALVQKLHELLAQYSDSRQKQQHKGAGSSSSGGGGGSGGGQQSDQRKRQRTGGSAAAAAGGSSDKTKNKAPHDVEVTNAAGKKVVRSSHVCGFCRGKKLCAFCFQDGHHSSACKAATPASGNPAGFRP